MLKTRSRDYKVIWPVYFERRVSRGGGRRGPSKLALDNVTVDRIVKACRELGLEYEVFEGAYPSMWWRRTGYVVVKADGVKKEELIRRIASAMKKR
ncbi:MAG TPA: hypothetical protein EYP20_00980 [Aigarchaeota archaeon]|nr:hypothetical protein [Aigarchaeota archaeon]